MLTIIFGVLVLFATIFLLIKRYDTRATLIGSGGNSVYYFLITNECF